MRCKSGGGAAVTPQYKPGGGRSVQAVMCVHVPEASVAGCTVGGVAHARVDVGL